MSDHISPICPRCDSNRTSRVKREGFFQTFVLPHLDRYPWECSGCRSVFTFKSRGKLKRHRRSASEVHMPPVANV